MEETITITNLKSGFYSTRNLGYGLVFTKYVTKILRLFNKINRNVHMKNLTQNLPPQNHFTGY